MSCPVDQLTSRPIVQSINFLQTFHPTRNFVASANIGVIFYLWNPETAAATDVREERVHIPPCRCFVDPFLSKARYRVWYSILPLRLLLDVRIKQLRAFSNYGPWGWMDTVAIQLQDKAMHSSWLQNIIILYSLANCQAMRRPSYRS